MVEVYNHPRSTASSSLCMLAIDAFSYVLSTDAQKVFYFVLHLILHSTFISLIRLGRDNFRIRFPTDRP